MPVGGVKVAVLEKAARGNTVGGDGDVFKTVADFFASVGEVALHVRLAGQLAVGDRVLHL